MTDKRDVEVSSIEAEVRDDDLAGIYMLTKSDRLLPAIRIAYQKLGYSLRYKL